MGIEKIEIANATMTAGAVIPENRIIKHGDGDGLAVQATSPADRLIGTSPAYDVPKDRQFSVPLAGVAPVEAGGAVTRGDRLTADANGKAVVAVAGNMVVGWATESGVAGDTIYYCVAVGRY